jgi:hypothetical protein
MNRSICFAALAAFGAAALSFPGLAQTVKVTPLGGIGSKTEAFIKAVKAPAHIPLSGKTMEFDAGGKCTAGC